VSEFMRNDEHQLPLSPKVHDHLIEPDLTALKPTFALVMGKRKNLYFQATVPANLL